MWLIAYVDAVLRMQAGVWYQKCYDPECRAYRSEAMPLPLQLAAGLSLQADLASPQLQECSLGPATAPTRGEHFAADAASLHHNQDRNQACNAVIACCAPDPPAAGKAMESGACMGQCAADEQASGSEANSTAAATGSVQVAACRPGGQSGAAVPVEGQNQRWQHQQAGVFADEEQADACLCRASTRLISSHE